jgi:hypothetical protein
MATAAHDVRIAERHRLWAASRRVVAVVVKPRWGWLGIGLIAVGLGLVYLLVAAWPAIVDATTKQTAPPPKPHAVHWLGWSFVPTTDSALLLLVVLVSALGSYVHAATSFADYAGNKKLNTGWLWWYLLRVFIGSSLAILFYFALRGGFFTAGSNSDDINPYGVAALAGVVGLFSKQATDKLREIFDTAFRVREGHGDDARSDSIVNARPVLVGVAPPKLTADTVELLLRGSGFGPDSVVSVLHSNGDAVPRTATYVDPTTLRVKVEEQDVAAAGAIRIQVHNPPPGGGTSDPLQVEVDDAAPAAGGGE